MNSKGWKKWRCIGRFVEFSAKIIRDDKKLWKKSIGEEAPIYYSDLDNDPNRDPNKPHEPGEVIEYLSKEDRISSEISSLISSGTVLDLPELYDQVLDNLSIASHDQIEVLLKAMGRPTESDNAKIIRSLNVHKAFDNHITGNHDDNYDKALIINWLKSLAKISEDHELFKTLNDREIQLRAEYIESSDIFCRQSDESERYKSLYDKISKITPKANQERDRARKLSSFLS